MEASGMALADGLLTCMVKVTGGAPGTTTGGACSSQHVAGPLSAGLCRRARSPLVRDESACAESLAGQTVPTVAVPRRDRSPMAGGERAVVAVTTSGRMSGSNTVAMAGSPNTLWAKKMRWAPYLPSRSILSHPRSATKAGPSRRRTRAGSSCIRRHRHSTPPTEGRALPGKRHTALLDMTPSS
jgi:hypothetical protein